MKSDTQNIAKFTEEIDSWLIYCKMRSTEVLPAEIAECKGLSSVALWNVVQTKKELREYRDHPLYPHLSLPHKELISEIEYSMDHYLNAYPLQNLNKIKHPLDSEYTPPPKPRSAKEEKKLCEGKKKRIEEQLEMALKDIDFFKNEGTFPPNSEDYFLLEKWQFFISDTLEAIQKFKGTTSKEQKTLFDTIYKEGFLMLSEENRMAFWQEMVLDFDSYHNWILFAEKTKIDKTILDIGYDRSRDYMKEVLEDVMPLAVDEYFNKYF